MDVEVVVVMLKWWIWILKWLLLLLWMLKWPGGCCVVVDVEVVVVMLKWPGGC